MWLTLNTPLAKWSKNYPRNNIELKITAREKKTKFQIITANFQRKEGKKEDTKADRNEDRKDGMKEGRKEDRKEDRKDDRMITTNLF